MSVTRRSTRPPFASTALRWGLYVIVGVSLVGLMLRVTARTVALAQSASPASSATATRAPTQVVVIAQVATTPAPTGTPVPPTPTVPPTATQIPGATLTAVYQADCSLYSQVP